MPEIKTEPVVACCIADREEFEQQLVPGAFLVQEGNGRIAFHYRCPCGCGSIGLLMVGRGKKPPESPTWKWNGSTKSPTLEPSVNHVGHWHGFLTDGVWRSA